VNRNKDWQKFEDIIVEQLKEVDPYAHTTKASGGSTIKGDITNSIGLHIECKQRNIKSVYNQDWYEKCEAEIPLHSDKIAVLCTCSSENKKMIHMSFDDFWRLYKEVVLSRRQK
jgi:hypothetical protein